MKSIYKYDLDYHGKSKIEIQGTGKVLYTAVQDGKLRVWVEVDTNDYIKQTLNFYVFHTGEEIPKCLENAKYIGTFVVEATYYVGHVYQY